METPLAFFMFPNTGAIVIYINHRPFSQINQEAKCK